MSDLNNLETQLLNDITAASDEAALESLRVGALGKKGSVSELLKTLGKMSPDERKEQGPLINGLRDKIASAIATRKAELDSAALDARLSAERVDMMPPCAKLRSQSLCTVQITRRSEA